MFPRRCNRDGDRLRCHLDKFPDRFDILNRTGDESFSNLYPGVYQFLIRNLRWSKRNKPFPWAVLHKCSPVKWNERGKEPVSYRTERMQLTASITVFCEPAGVID